MLSKNHIRFLHSLQRKKFRDEYQLFTFEGDKLIREYLSGGGKLHLLLAKPEWIKQLTNEQLERVDELIPAKYEDLKKVSQLKTPNNALAVACQPAGKLSLAALKEQLFLVLEEIQDPGNLGAIMRIAAWFGIPDIICSPDSVDLYNPKVIQASMGSFMHVQVHYRELLPFLQELKAEGIVLHGTTLQGKPLASAEISAKGAILMGNESRGLSEPVRELLDTELLIPSTGETGAGLDSLNVAMATGILCYEFRRRV